MFFSYIYILKTRTGFLKPSKMRFLRLITYYKPLKTSYRKITLIVLTMFYVASSSVVKCDFVKFYIRKRMNLRQNITIYHQ